MYVFAVEEVGQVHEDISFYFILFYFYSCFYADKLLSLEFAYWTVVRTLQ